MITGQAWFDRWIRIHYRSKRAVNRGRFGCEFSGDDDEETRPIVGVELDFEICEISGVVSGRGRRGRHEWQRGDRDYRIWRRLRRVGSAWEVDGAEEALSDAELPDGCVPFTEARYQSLLAIQDGIRGIAALLDGVVGEAAIQSGEAARRLEAPGAQRLIAAPSAEPEAKPRRSR